MYEEGHLLHKGRPNTKSTVIQIMLYVLDYHMINVLLMQIEENVVHGNDVGYFQILKEML